MSIKKFYGSVDSKLSESKKERSQRLLEFKAQSGRSPAEIAQDLQVNLGKLIRIGGSGRIYEVGAHQLGEVFAVDNQTKAFGLAWNKENKGLGVQTIYVWDEFDINKQPDFALDLPQISDFYEISNDVANWIKRPKTGKIVVESFSGKAIMEARQTTEDEFVQMVRGTPNIDPSNVTIVELNKIAMDNDVKIPGSVRQNPKYKRGAFNYDFTDNASASVVADTNKKLGNALGAPVEEPDATLDPDYDTMLNLAKAKTATKLATSGKLYLMGRKPNGAFFRVHGLDSILDKLTRMLTRQLSDNKDGKDGMEEQYEMLEDKVKLVAGGQSAFIKSLLITGAPSSGKSYVVMKTIKGLGLKEGTDYTVKKGRITTVAMYRTLIERIDSLTVFDDCDSVVEDKNAVNMLKGALDTDAVREISYDVRGTMQTANLSSDARDALVDSISRILRNVPIEGDIARFEPFLKKAKKTKATSDDDNEDEYDDALDLDGNGEMDDDQDSDDYKHKLHEVQDYLIKRLPNKIDYKGRIIFISNMDETEWDSAILTRAFTVNMNFSSAEMLDYIDKIKSNIPTPNLSEDEKQEVIDYMRELYVNGTLKRQINFRLVQQAFDLRLMSNWKHMMARSL